MTEEESGRAGRRAARFDLPGLHATLRKSPFVRNFLKMLGGSALARVIAIGVAPIIARIFDPGVFGLAAVFSALVLLLTTLATLRFEQAIVIANDDADAAALTRLTLSVLSFSTVLTLVVLALLLAFEVPLGEYASLGGWLLLVPAGIFLTGLGQLLRGRLVRLKRFGKVAQGEIVMAAGSASSRIAGGLTIAASLGMLIGGQLLGMLARAGYLAFDVSRHGRGATPPPRRSLRQVAHEYRQFPVYSTPTAFLRSFSENLPLLAIGILYLPAIAGFYAFARRLMVMPASMINQAVRQVYLQKAAELHNAGRGTRSALTRTTLVLLAIGLPLAAGLMAFGEPLFGLLLGERWITAGRYAEIISPWLLFSVASAPASATYVVYRRQRRLLGIQVTMTAVRLAIVFYAYLSGLAVVPLLILLTAASIAGYSWIMLAGFAIAGQTPPVGAIESARSDDSDGEI